MISPESPAKTRSRFGNVINANAVPWEAWGQEKGRYGGQERPISKLIGARDLGYHLEIVSPGMLSVPYHFHHHEEEMFFVLEGHAMLRQGDSSADEEIEVGPGDFVAYAPGTGIAHQFRNHTDRPFYFLALSNKVASDVVEYPDSDKLLVRSKGLIVRRSPRLDYWDGEA
jgi:uncharacterized cupin superfamily protein